MYNSLNTWRPKEKLFSKRFVVKNKNSIFFIFVFVLMMANGQGADAQNGVGIYFDPEASSTSVTTTEPYSQVQGWLLLTSPTSDGPITGFELQVQVHTEGPDPIVIWNLPPQSVNELDAPQLKIWFGQALTASPIVELAQVTILVPEAGQTVWLTIHSLDDPTMTEPPEWGTAVYWPSYSSGDPTSYVSMNSAQGCLGKPAAGINGDSNPPRHAWSDPPLDIGVFDVEGVLPTFSLQNQGEVIVQGELTLNGNSPVLVQVGDGPFSAEGLQFQVLPGQSVDFLFEVPNSGSIEKTVHLEICDWQFDSHFTRNGGEPSARWDPAEVDFGIVTLGLDSPEHLIAFTNTGQDILYPSEVIHSGDFLLETPYWYDPPLYPNQVVYYVGVFSPSVTGPATEIVESYYSENTLTLYGHGVDASPVCDIHPSAMDFGEVAVGEPPYYVRYVCVSNEGGEILEGEFVFDDPDGGFIVESDPGAFALSHGEAACFGLRCEPPIPGYFEATLSAGPNCQEVTISGTGVEIGPTCEWTCSYLVGDVVTLPLQAVGHENYYGMTYRNRGGEFLNVDISLEDPTGTFTMVNGGGAHSISPYTGLSLQFKYDPVAAGRDTAILHTDSICGDILLVGHAAEPWPDCLISPDDIEDFGSLRVDDSGTRTVRARNTGYTTLDGFWETEGDDFSLDLPGPFTLEPGQYTDRILSFFPQDAGPSFGWVSTGLDSCLGFSCQGLGIPLESNRMGLYWNEGASITGIQTEQDSQIVTLYLILTAPFDAAYISGWSMSYSIEGPAEIQSGWGFPLPGQHSWMVGNRHDFQFETPQLLYDGLVLAEIPVLVPTPGEISSLGLYAGSYKLNMENVWFDLVLEEDATVNSGLSGVEIETDLPTPSRTVLNHCYPNPFNPEVHIPFELARRGQVRVTIYDLAGRLVKELIQDSFEPGRYELVWNGRDSHGRSVPSNIYYVRLSAHGGVQMQKITMVK